MVTLKSFACGQWHTGTGPLQTLSHAVTGEPIAEAGSGGLDFRAVAEYGRATGGPNLRALTFPVRAALLKKFIEVLNAHLPEFQQIAATYGATRADAAMDIEGGIGTLAVYASLGAKQLPNATFLVDGDAVRLSKDGNFAGRHIWVSREGVAVFINAYNFPSWGLLEKLGPAILAGMPVIVKPATATAWLTFRMVEVLVEAGVVPDGVLQLVCGSIGDLFEHLNCQDVVSFTGSAATGQLLRAHPNVIRNAVRVNVEADSLNCIILGPDAQPGSAVFERGVKEVVREMTVKAGQKCTAIRRILVPAEHEDAVIAELRVRLTKTVVGDPAVEVVRMGPLINREARDTALQAIGKLRQEAEVVCGDPDRSAFQGGDTRAGAFLEPILLRCAQPEDAVFAHEVEAFGPVATVMPYSGAEQAARLARKGGGSLVSSVFSEDEEFVSTLAFGLAPYHGRLMVMNEKAAAESTGHGVAIPQLVHGGPGRAGGGEEMGGLRGLQFYMQRTALQGTPERLENLCRPALPDKPAETK